MPKPLVSTQQATGSLPVCLWSHSGALMCGWPGNGTSVLDFLARVWLCEGKEQIYSGASVLMASF